MSPTANYARIRAVLARFTKGGVARAFRTWNAFLVHTARIRKVLTRFMKGGMARALQSWKDFLVHNHKIRGHLALP
ncbi:hypothetical protein T484DRAFT_1863634 [Baffinella frigidus]|nr:hypothetical protein T484DRAFT_1863634 [Cryptophyta sp. CCMP2293]